MRCQLNPGDKFRKQAEVANKMAARSVKDEDKLFWRRLAENWLKLAASADETDKRRKPLSGK
jgi:hypothetical protein